MLAVSRIVRFLCGLGCVCVSLSAKPAFQSWFTGNEEDVRPPTRGGLLLSGGGGDVDEAWRWFLRCAGGGDIVVLRASGGDAYQDYLYNDLGGINSIRTLLVHGPEASSSDELLAFLGRAEGIFLAGGDQARYITWWKDTPLADALNAHVAAGRPIGGTSAGLAVLGEVYFAALKDTVTSEQTLNDPFHERVTLGTGFLTIDRLAGVLTDSHFSERTRLGRLITFLARQQHESSPGSRPTVGLGLDERTTVCVEDDGTAKVVSTTRPDGSSGKAWLVTLGPDRPLVARGQPLTARGVRVVGLDAGSSLRLPSGAVENPSIVRTVDIIDGKLMESP